MFIWPVVAVVAILVAVRLYGARGSAGFATDEAVVALLREEHPEFVPVEVTRGVDRRAALVSGPEESVAVAFAVGNMTTSRVLTKGDVAHVDTTRRVGLVDATIRTHDMGAPALTVTLRDGEWDRWSARLGHLATALLFLGVAIPLGGQCPVRLDPATPRPGAFFRVVVPAGAVRARLGGEPLHLTAGPNPQEQVAIAGTNIEASRLTLVVQCPATPGDSTVVTVDLAAGSYPTERLRVAPAFTKEPDSALAARIAREGERARQVGMASHATPALWSGPFLRPRASRVTSVYGMGRTFNGRVTSRHMGTDFAGASGEPVHAMNRGVVRLVDRFYLGGRVVYVDHGMGITTAYLHLSRFLVAPGDTVRAGQQIGEVGATGRVTGPHLHVIARYGTTSLDPLSLVALTTAPAARAQED